MPLPFRQKAMVKIYKKSEEEDRKKPALQVHTDPYRWNSTNNQCIGSTVLARKSLELGRMWL